MPSVPSPDNPSLRTYTISEVSALTGLHRNTIRMRIKTGQLDADVRQGKFGEEYRIAHAALVAQGLLAADGPSDSPLGEPILNAEYVSAEPHTATDSTPRFGALPPVADPSTLAALGDLYQRHEQAMFRLGYMQGELDRVKALADTAESLREERGAQDRALQEAHAALEEKVREAADADRVRQELRIAQEQLKEIDALRDEIDALKQLAVARPWWRFWGT